MRSLIEISNFTFLLVLFMFIMALLGMEMFAFSAAYNSDNELLLGEKQIQEAFEEGELMWPRENFNNVFNALITVFIVIVAEDWNQVMYLYVRAAGESSPLSWNIALIYFLLTMIIGNII